MTIASPRKPKAVKGRSAQALEIAERAIQGVRIRPKQNVNLETCVMNLAKILMSTHPQSEHGKLLMLALSPTGGRERSLEEQAVRWLLRSGESPTAEAVAGRVTAVREQEECEVSRWESAREIASRDGFRAAQIISDRIEQTGEAPTWFELARSLNWTTYRPVMVKIFTCLEKDGWIITGKEKRSIRPGDKYHA